MQLRHSSLTPSPRFGSLPVPLPVLALDQLEGSLGFTALVAVRAPDDLVLPALFVLRGPKGIRKDRSRDAHQVGLALLQNAFRDISGGDTAGRYNGRSVTRLPQGAADLGRYVYVHLRRPPRRAHCAVRSIAALRLEGFALHGDSILKLASR